MDEAEELTSSHTLLEALLGAQQGEGTFQGSSGFTLDAQSALRKLSEHQLGQPGLWLVKVVQAAVAAGAAEVRVTFGRIDVTVNFEPAQRWQGESLLELVLSGQSPSDRALRHLVTGLRGSLSGRSEQVRWSYGQTRVAIAADGYHVEPQEESGIFSLTSRRRARLTSLRALGGGLSRLLRMTVDEQEALAARCFVSPVPIIVDGRALPRGWSSVSIPELVGADGMVKRGDLKSVHAGLGLAYLPRASGRPELPELPVEGATDQPVVAKPTYKGETFLINPRPSRPPRGVVSILSSFLHRSRVDLVLDGAVVESRPLHRWMVHSTTPGAQRLVHHALAVRLAFAVRPEELDLGEFSAGNIDVDKLVEQALPTVEELLAQISSHLSHFFYLPLSRDRRAVTFTLCSAPGVLLAATVGAMALVPLGAAGGLAAWAGTQYSRDLVSKALASLGFMLETGHLDPD